MIKKTVQTQLRLFYNLGSGSHLKRILNPFFPFHRRIFTLVTLFVTLCEQVVKRQGKGVCSRVLMPETWNNGIENTRPQCLESLVPGSGKVVELVSVSVHAVERELIHSVSICTPQRG